MPDDRSDDHVPEHLKPPERSEPADTAPEHLRPSPDAPPGAAGPLAGSPGAPDSPLRLLPEDLVDRLFARAAAFYRAAPWEVLSADDLLHATAPGGREWTVSVTAVEEGAPGLRLFASEEDAGTPVVDPLSGEPLSGIGPGAGPGVEPGAEPGSEPGAGPATRPAGRVLALTFVSTHALPAELLREVEVEGAGTADPAGAVAAAPADAPATAPPGAPSGGPVDAPSAPSAAGRPVASPEAYPRIAAAGPAPTHDLPASAPTPTEAEDLAALLAAVLRFAEAAGRRVVAMQEVPGWRDEETGVEITFDPDRAYGADLGPPDRVHTGGPGGPGAEPQAAVSALDDVDEDLDALVDRELPVAERFAASGTAEPEDGVVARAFVRFLAGRHGVPVRAVHEFDLRAYVEEQRPAEAPDEGPEEALRVHAALGRFFDHLAEAEGIRCPWIERVLVRPEDVPDVSAAARELERRRERHDDRLDAELMLPPAELAPGLEPPGPGMGPVEARLRHELQRRWLLWRDELIAAGADHWSDLAPALLEHQRTWADEPHPRLDGASPAEAVRAERADS